MRLIPIFAAAIFSLCLGAAPAAAETRTATSPTTVATPLMTAGVDNAGADQYRSRYRDRYGYRYRSGWRNDRYRPRYYSSRTWRRGRVVCRTSWRYGRPRRVCYRRW